MTHVVIVGGGFAGMACAYQLTNSNVRITLIDKNDYNQFKPLLYQVATSAISTESVAFAFRTFFKNYATVDIKMDEAVSVDPKTLTVKTKNGNSYQGDYLVLSAGSVVNFFDTPGAEANSFPLYTLHDAENLRSRILAVFEDADRDPKLIDQGALNFVIIGAGATGTEVAGALADMIDHILPEEFADLMINKAAIHLVDHSSTVLRAFSENSQEYASKILQKRGVKLHLGLLVKEVASDHVLLSDGSKILTHTPVWAGGLKACPLANLSGLKQGHGGRIEVNPDLSAVGFPNIFVLGDLANYQRLPQLASVAQQGGKWTANNIAADLAGKPRTPFHYHDKGIMAMIGKDAAVAEIGEKRHQLEGTLAFAAWLGVHVALLSTFRQKVETVVDWAWDYFGKRRVHQILDREDKANIKWKE